MFSSLVKKNDTSTSTLLFAISHKKIFTKNMLVFLSLLPVDVSTYLHLVFIPTQKTFFPPKSLPICLI